METWPGWRRQFVVCLVVGLMATASPLASAGQTSPAAPSNPPNGLIAVVPLQNLSGDAADEWIGAGIAETLTTDLEAGREFDVIDRDLVVHAMNDLGQTAPDDDGVWLEVARRVGARWLVNGAYQRLGDQIRITARMVEVASGQAARSAKVDGALADLFVLQDRVSSQLTGGAPIPAPARAGEGSQAASPALSASAPERFPVPPDTTAADEGNGGAAPSEVVATPSTINTGGVAFLNAIDGPAPPIAPEVMNRDENGRATVRAIRLTAPIQLDGQLDEQVYYTVPAITDFLQQIPVEGAPATERTEAWIMFDEQNVYVGARVHDSAPRSEWVANEMRRDTNQLRQNDTFTAFFDTFYDRRNGFSFYTNPLGARADQQFTNEGNPNTDWNPVWDVRTGRFDGGWTVEMEIPFKTLRYRSGSPQLWGVQLRRVIRRKNEWTYLTQMPISVGGPGGIFRVSQAATLVGMEPPASGRTFEIKPYSIGGLTTDVGSGIENEGDGDFGVDAKYGITQNLTADLTYNTDFAQVEVDEQQVNLTRFSLFFPEKREFFLEGRGIFEFARGGSGTRRRGARGSGGSAGTGPPTIFYSRRIGLERGTVVPIYGGGRVTGKLGAFDVGALSIQTEDSLEAGTESTNFTVLRVKRDILRRSSIGGIFTNRSVSRIGDGMNQAFGVDATFAFFDNVSMVTYFAKTETPGITGEDTSYQGQFNYGGDRYGFTADHVVVEDNFIPEVGFVRRDNFRRTNVAAQFSPRPQGIDAIRQFTFEGSLDYYLTADTRLLETRQRGLRFDTEFENSDRLSVNVTDNYELLEDDFEISDGIILPIGGYGFSNAEVSYSFGGQRRANGTVSFRKGAFWSGNIDALTVSQGRINVLDQFSIEPSVSLNWVDLPEGSFNTTLVSSRFNYAFSPWMFFSGLMQYNTNTDVVSANLRLRWEYQPGSELFVVYTEERDTETLMPDRFSELRNRGFVVKINRLFRF